MWGRGPRGSNATCSALRWLSVTSPTTLKQIGPFWCWFLGGWVCAHSRTLWVSQMNSPGRLGVSPTTATPIVFHNRRFWGFLFQSWNPGLHGLSGSPVVPPGLSAHKCGTAWSSSCHLAACLLHPNCQSPPLLPVWMNVSSSIPWFLDFHIVWFSGSYGYFLFLPLLLSSFWLCEEAKCIYLYLHIVQKSLDLNFINPINTYIKITVYIICEKYLLNLQKMCAVQRDLKTCQLLSWWLGANYLRQQKEKL